LEHIPFLNLSWQHDLIEEAVQKAFARVYDRNWFILGKEVDLFEKEFAAYHDVPHCIAVGNGLDALTLSLQACGIRPGDEVIVPAHTYLATWLAVTRLGAVPVPVDADPATSNIDVDKIPDRVTERTRVIVPVHLYGQPCNMTRIDELSRQLGLIIVEDNAQSHGAMWREKLTGSFGSVNATSFYPTKNLGALGDGGAVTTFDDSYARFVRANRNYGCEQRHHATYQGMNSRLDEIQAAVLRIKLLYLERWNEERRSLASCYLERLNDIPGLILPRADKEALHVYHLFVIQSPRRDKLRDHLAGAAIETMIHYPIPPHQQQAFRDLNFRKGDFPVAEQIAEQAISLPLWPGMKETEVDRVCSAVRAFCLKA
jgi:dTDP-4-amino-4,6-dideoxygalactose transaminase